MKHFDVNRHAVNNVFFSYIPCEIVMIEMQRERQGWQFEPRLLDGWMSHVQVSLSKDTRPPAGSPGAFTAARCSHCVGGKRQRTISCNV